MTNIRFRVNHSNPLGANEFPGSSKQVVLIPVEASPISMVRTEELPSEQRLRGVISQAVKAFSWRELSDVFERPFRTVVSFCRAVLRRGNEPDTWVIQDYVLAEIQRCWTELSAEGVTLTEMPNRILRGLRQVFWAMRDTARQLRRRLAWDRHAFLARVPGYAGVELMLIVRTDPDDPGTGLLDPICAVETPSRFARHAQRRFRPEREMDVGWNTSCRTWRRD